jgi:hypothetical protein
MMAADDLPPTTSVAWKFGRYALSFGVTLVVGLAPLLGKSGVRLFTPLATLIPLNLQEGVLALAGFLMALTAVAAQFFASDNAAFGKRRMRTMFLAVFLGAVVVTLALSVVYSFYVEKIELEGGKFSARYIVGETMLPTCPCVAQKKPISTCIGSAITTNPAEVSACYPRSEIAGRQAVLSLLYLLTMLSFGMLIGLVVLRERKPKPGRMRKG